MSKLLNAILGSEPTNFKVTTTEVLVKRIQVR